MRDGMNSPYWMLDSAHTIRGVNENEIGSCAGALRYRPRFGLGAFGFSSIGPTLSTVSQLLGPLAEKYGLPRNRKALLWT